MRGGEGEGAKGEGHVRVGGGGKGEGAKGRDYVRG